MSGTIQPPAQHHVTDNHKFQQCCFQKIKLMGVLLSIFPIIFSNIMFRKHPPDKNQFLALKQCTARSPILLGSTFSK